MDVGYEYGEHQTNGTRHMKYLLARRFVLSMLLKDEFIIMRSGIQLGAIFESPVFHNFICSITL